MVIVVGNQDKVSSLPNDHPVVQYVPCAAIPWKKRLN